MVHHINTLDSSQDSSGDRILVDNYCPAIDCRMRLQRLAQPFSARSSTNHCYHKDAVYLHSRSRARVLLMR